MAMPDHLIYVPIFRGRQEENKVVTSFDFGTRIYPYLEIIRELDRKPPTPKKGKPAAPRQGKKFEDIYLPLLKKIRTPRVFVDLPVHFVENNRVKQEVLEFVRRVIADRKERTQYMLKFKPLARRVIPVISTYSQRKSAEPDSILRQENDLRGHFSTLAFRTGTKTFFNDMKQVTAVARGRDFLFVDLESYPADTTDDDVMELMDELDRFNKCKVIVIKAAIDKSVKNVELRHGKRVKGVDNGLLSVYSGMHADGFGDYAGIKKDDVEKGGGKVMPGFIFFDAVENEFYGFKGSDVKDLNDFESVIVPAVLKHESIKRMEASGLSYLSDRNKGWELLQNIKRGIEPGKSPAKFKRISMEHYLHCIRTKIEAGHFDD